MKYCKIILFYWGLLFSLYGNSQTLVTGRILDSNGVRIPFAAITIGEKIGVMSNSEGFFTIRSIEDFSGKDTLHVSCLGYESKKIPFLKFSSKEIVLKEASVELDEILISSKKYSGKDIVKKSKEHFKDNYITSDEKREIFFRVENIYEFDKREVVIEESTIPEITQSFVDSLVNVYPQYFIEYKEILGSVKNKENVYKLEVTKAAAFLDEEVAYDLDDLEEKVEHIFKKRVKRDSYLRFQFSWFLGVNQSLDTLMYNESENVELLKEKKRDFVDPNSYILRNIEKDNLVHDDSDLDFIFKYKRYDYKLLGVTTLGETNIFIISFESEGRADYKGKLYINTDDFSVLRVDYENIKPLEAFNLLGISYKHRVKKGVLMYDKGSDGFYRMNYLYQENNMEMGFDRSLKILEKNKRVKGRNTQNTIDLDLDFQFTEINKRELIVLDREPIGEKSFEEFPTDTLFKPIYIKEYTPLLWNKNVIIDNQELNVIREKLIK